MFRTHCNLDDTTAPSGCYPRKTPDPATGGTACTGCERRIWKFPHFEQMKDAMLLRNSLAPYIYTAAREHYDTGVALVRPLYYEYPELEEAYNMADSQYFFGNDMLVAPIAEPSDNPSPYKGKSNKTIWLPPGVWSSWDGCTQHVGPKKLTLSYTLSQIPIFVAASSVIPTKTMAS